MKQASVWGLLWTVGLLCALGAQAQRSSPVGDRLDKIQAVPELPAENGKLTPLGTAPELSVFSVIKFSGVLKDAMGEPQTGTLGVTFAFYSEREGGAPLWLETQNIQPDPQGRYTVLLGALQAEGLPLELFASGARLAGWASRCRAKPNSRVSCW